MEILIADKIKILSQDLQHLPQHSDRAKSLLNLIQKEKDILTNVPWSGGKDNGLQHLEISLKHFYLNKEFKYTVSLLKHYLDCGNFNCPEPDDCRYKQIRELLAQIVG